MTTPEPDRLFTPPPLMTSPALTPPGLTPPPPTPPNGVPLPYQAAPPPTTGPSRAPVVALSALAAVFALVAGLFTALYLGERTDRDTIASTRADQERTLANVTGRQEQADATLETNRSRESTLTTQHDLLTQCVEAAKGYFALPPGQTPESSRLFRVMYDVCPQI
ncbi:hypothetical protein B0I31_12747 [Saccharothrix carnea]|uniref:Uncharacterized protein n=1 Tax=Saccharothrix carnea TaxID=1280637 RepID=A0A2P8HGE7_SACCR|nr:hypothetical protein [Saccharothrix carnea]PSL45270.1 hypothetical protein B0I31_12747 [Saccharothrix carnea]